MEQNVSLLKFKIISASECKNTSGLSSLQDLVFVSYLTVVSNNLEGFFL